MKCARDSGSPKSKPAVSAAFSLIEIVIVLGIVAFALIPLMASLIVAYDQNEAARKITERALIMQSCESLVRNTRPADLKTKLSSGSLVYYFAEGGRYTGTQYTTPAYYRCTATPVAGGPQTNQRVCALMTISYPAPAYPNSFSFPVGSFNYGSKLP